jgi:hypothetical protein
LNWEKLIFKVVDLSECQGLKHIPLGVGKIQGLETLILPKDLSQIEGNLLEGRDEKKKKKKCTLL